MAGAPTTCGASPSSESDDEGEDEDEEGEGDDSSAKDASGCVFIRDALLPGIFFETSTSSDEEPKSDDEDDAWRRLRFLLRLRGAVGLAVGIWWCAKCPVRCLHSVGVPHHASMATDFWASSHK